MAKYWKWMICLLSVGMVISSCEIAQKPQSDPRDAFVGEYTFVSTGEIDLYAGAAKLYTLPMNQNGEMKIVPGEEQNSLWVIAEGDSTEAYISGNYFFMNPTYEEVEYGELVMEMTFTYGKATLEGNQLSMSADVDIRASYRDYNLSGNGQVDVVATKK